MMSLKPVFSLILGTAVISSLTSSLRGAAGDAETAFDAGSLSSASVAFPRLDGKIFLGGGFTSVGGTARSGLALLDSSGKVMPDFNPNAGTGGVRCLSLLKDGKIIVGGGFTTMGGVARNRIARLNPDGTLDTSFNPMIGGGASGVTSIVDLMDGRVVIAGDFTSVNGVTRNRVARLLADGSLDANFNPNAGATVWTLALQPDGKIVIGGEFTTVGGVARNRAARILSDGTLDTDFNPNVNSYVLCSSVLADGKILIGGGFSQIGGTSRPRLARLNSNGTLDTTFNARMDAGFLADILTIAIQADGKILPGGGFVTAGGGVTRNRIARLLPTGALDTDFNPNASARVDGIMLGPDGRIWTCGSFLTIGGLSRQRLARLENEAATQSLAIIGGNRIEWLRGGSAPETHQVEFQWSNDGGVSYSTLGAGTRIAGGWEQAGVSLPASGILRALAKTQGGNMNGSGGLVKKLLPVGLTHREDWRVAHFDLAINAGVSADTADPDGDGLVNLVEYGLGLDPNAAGVLQAQLVRNSGICEYVYTRSKSAFSAGLQFQVEWTDTLEVAGWSTSGVTEQLISDNGITQQVKATFPAGSAGRRFVRLRLQ